MSSFDVFLDFWVRLKSAYVEVSRLHWSRVSTMTSVSGKKMSIVFIGSSDVNFGRLSSEVSMLLSCRSKSSRNKRILLKILDVQLRLKQPRSSLFPNSILDKLYLIIILTKRKYTLAYQPVNFYC